MGDRIFARPSALPNFRTSATIAETCLPACFQRGSNNMATCTPGPRRLELVSFRQFINHRDQRLLDTARMEVEKCAVVRTLVKQKGHLQKMMAHQERELQAIKQTQVRANWSRVLFYCFQNRF